MIAELTKPKIAALVALLSAVVALGGAWIIEYGFGYLPCALCLEQRVPYYFGIPLAVGAFFMAGAGLSRQAGLALMAFGLLFAYGAGLGAYHSGVEWGWWPGPDACSGAGGLELDAGKLFDNLGKTTPPSCTEAALRIFGLSLAGYNVLISAPLAILAILAGYKARFAAKADLANT